MYLVGCVVGCAVGCGCSLQVRSLEEVGGNVRDMIVRPLQQLVDLPDNGQFRGGGGGVGVGGGWQSGSALAGSLTEASLGSHVHLFATLVRTTDRSATHLEKQRARVLRVLVLVRAYQPHQPINNRPTKSTPLPPHAGAEGLA